MLLFYFIFSLCIVASCNQDGEWLKCKPKPGCSIAQCDPRPAGQWFGNDGLDNHYPILCQQNEASSSTTADTENVNKFDEIRITFSKLEGRLERSEKVELQMNSEITSLKKTNVEMRNEMDSVKEEAEEDKGKLNVAMKQITVLEKKNAEMKRMEKQTNERITDLEKTNSEMRNEMDKMKKEAKGNKGKLDEGMKILCPVIYENKCFISVIGREVNYDDGVAVCKNRGGHLSNIYSQTHMDDIMKYIRENRMDGSSQQDFRLGMKYDPKAKKLRLRDGTDAPAGLKWDNGFPANIEDHGASNADWTSVILTVRNDQSSINQYLFNFPPSSSYYVICEIE